MTRDYYADATALSENMAKAGYTTWADQIRDAIAGGSTATEILMGLRWIISSFLEKEAGLSPEIRAEGIVSGLP